MESCSGRVGRVDKIIVTGRGPLVGEVGVAGSKNAVLPSLFATVLTSERCRLRNVPRLTDVRTACRLLAVLGVSVNEIEDGRFVRVFQRVQNWLLAAVKADEVLDPKQRRLAGNELNYIGDPRFDPDRWRLPMLENSGFVKIPAGSFLMGSDKEKDPRARKDELPQHTVKLSEYWINVHPVTVAQYKVFLDDCGEEPDEDWKKENKYDE